MVLELLTEIMSKSQSTETDGGYVPWIKTQRIATNPGTSQWRLPRIDNNNLWLELQKLA